MYETITYAELKSLPKEQKIEALKELKALYSSQKKIAEKLGVNPPNIYNMIARYIREDRGKKGESGQGRLENEAAVNRKVRGGAAANRKADGEASGIHKSRGKATGNKKVCAESAKNEAIGNQPIGSGVIINEATGNQSIKSEVMNNETMDDQPIINKVIRTDDSIAYAIDRYSDKYDKRREDYTQNGFMISISKELTGDEAQTLLTGIGNIFIKNHDYRVELRITEK